MKILLLLPGYRRRLGVDGTLLQVLSFFICFRLRLKKKPLSMHTVEKNQIVLKGFLNKNQIVLKLSCPPLPPIFLTT